MIIIKTSKHEVTNKQEEKPIVVKVEEQNAPTVHETEPNGKSKAAGE